MDVIELADDEVSVGCGGALESLVLGLKLVDDKEDAAVEG